MLIRPGRDAIQRLVRMALDEDAPWGDLTSQTLIAASMRVTAQLVAREPGVLSGEDVFIAAMSLTDPDISTRFAVHDGESFRRRPRSSPRSRGPRRVSCRQSASLSTLSSACRASPR